MDSQPQAADDVPRRKYTWPWFALAAIVLATALAIAWMSVAVSRLRRSQNLFPQASSLQTNTASLSPTNDPIAGFRDLLSGGNAAAGQKIFFEKPEANCAKCHQVGGQGGNTGPILHAIGTKLTGEGILESMLRPNLRTTEGYESIILLQKNGSGCSGFLKNENESEIYVLTPEEGLVKVRKSDIQLRQKGLSPMPEGLNQILTRADLRNLVAFLASRK